jgi:hypothetical protein
MINHNSDLFIYFDLIYYKNNDTLPYFGMRTVEKTVFQHSPRVEAAKKISFLNNPSIEIAKKISFLSNPSVEIAKKISFRTVLK